jgi:hypothetical protein
MLEEMLNKWRKTSTFRLKGHYTILKRVFNEPPRSDIRWGKIEDLLKALKAEVHPGLGDSMRIRLNNVIGDVPTPIGRDRPATKGTVREIRYILKKAGVTPERVQEFL